MIVDVERVIAKQLIEANLAGGNVIIANGSIDFKPPAVFVSLSSTTGNRNDGYMEHVVTVSCIEYDEYAALLLMHFAIKVLDGFSGGGLYDVHHISTIPQRTTESSPVTHTFVAQFRVVSKL